MTEDDKTRTSADVEPLAAGATRRPAWVTGRGGPVSGARRPRGYGFLTALSCVGLRVSSAEVGLTGPDRGGGAALAATLARATRCLTALHRAAAWRVCGHATTLDVHQQQGGRPHLP